MVKKNTAVRIKERDLDELEKLEKKEDETVSSLIRQAIREFLDKKEGSQCQVKRQKQKHVSVASRFS